MPNCTHCSKEIMIGDRYCKHCGNAINGGKALDENTNISSNATIEQLIAIRKSMQEMQNQTQVLMQMHNELIKQSGSLRAISQGLVVLVLLSLLASCGVFFSSYSLF